MTWQIAVTFGVLAGVIAGLTLTRLAPDMMLVGGLALLVVCGVLTPEAAFGGFANEGLTTIAALFIVAEGLRRTGGINFIGRKLLGEPKSLAGAQLRLITPVAGLSAFLNNTPLVAKSSLPTGNRRASMGLTNSATVGRPSGSFTVLTKPRGLCSTT